MTAHLPECPRFGVPDVADGDDFHDAGLRRMWPPCICPALRACTVRVLGEARGAVLGPLMHDDACCSNGCTEQHWTEWDSRQRGLAALGLPVADVSTRPPSRCDGSCNCIAPPYAAAIDRLAQEAP